MATKKKMTVTEALLQAITMLDTIAKGGQYDAKEYHDLLHEIRRVHTEAVVEEAEHPDSEDGDTYFSCQVMGHDILETREILRVQVDGDGPREFALEPGDGEDLTGKSVLLRYVEGDQYAVVMEVL